jgi:hypothetical protein
MLHPILGTLINFAIESFVSTHFGKPQDRAYPHVASLIPFFPRLYIVWLATAFE